MRWNEIIESLCKRGKFNSTCLNLPQLVTDTISSAEFSGWIFNDFSWSFIKRILVAAVEREKKVEMFGFFFSIILILDNEKVLAPAKIPPSKLPFYFYFSLAQKCVRGNMINWIPHASPFLLVENSTKV